MTYFLDFSTMSPHSWLTTLTPSLSMSLLVLIWCSENCCFLCCCFLVFSLCCAWSGQSMQEMGQVYFAAEHSDVEKFWKISGATFAISHAAPVEYFRKCLDLCACWKTKLCTVPKGQETNFPFKCMLKLSSRPIQTSFLLFWCSYSYTILYSLIELTWNRIKLIRWSICNKNRGRYGLIPVEPSVSIHTYIWCGCFCVWQLGPEGALWLFCWIATILCCQTGCKVTLERRISSGWGSFSWSRRECLRTPAELRWAPSHLIGVEEMMRYLPSQGHPMLQWFPQTVSSIRNNPAAWRARELGDFRAKQLP